MLFSHFSVSWFNWYLRYESYLKEGIFRLDNILKNALFDEFTKKQNK